MALSLISVDPFDAVAAQAGFWFQTLMTTSGYRCVYHDQTDRIYFSISNTYPGGATGDAGWYDPYFAVGTAPSCQRFAGAPGWVVIHAVGDWDRVLNRQYLYGRITSDIERVSITSLQSDGIVYPNLLWTGSNNGKISTQDGFWSVTSAQDWHFFETLGYAIVVGGTSVRFGGVTYNTVAVQVDLATGDGVPIAGFPTRCTTSPNIYQRPQVFGDSVTLNSIQFIPDDDSTPAQPKGLMMQYSSERIATGDSMRDYVRFSDWNPTGKVAAAGTSNRVHLRELSLSRLEYLDGATGAYPTGLGGGATQAHSNFMFIHPPTRILSIIKTVGSAHVANQTTLRGRFATTPGVSFLTPPAPARTVGTASTIPFVATVSGSLGERIAGVNVAFTLKRAATFEEPLTIGAPGSSSVIAQHPDNDPAFQPIVKKNGTPLTVTTHYTIDYVNDEVDFVAPEPVGGNTYTITYRHRTEPVSPPHGSLLNSTTLTDEAGHAIALVRYDNNANLVGMMDSLEATA